MSSMDSKYTIGIDLGTTYCSVAVFHNGIVKVLEDELGNRRVPSYVAFTDHECLVGFSAKGQAFVNPANTVYGVKRLLGRKFADPVVSSNTKYWPFSVIDENGKPKIEVQYKKAKASFFPEEITAMLLTRMKEIAESYIGASGISDAVISVPANFNYLQRMATVNAASIAGLKVTRLINEPTAAALAYFNERKIASTPNLLVFAIGGGSFDISIVSMENGILRVKAVSGETQLGGEDFDNNLLHQMPTDFLQNETNDIIKKKIFARLKNTCEDAKKDLSKLTKTSIAVEGCDYSLAVNREDFTKYNDQLYSKMMCHVEKVLQHARSSKLLKHDDIIDILLVGGSTRIPHVEELLKSKFSGLRISKGINRDEAVTCGAAVQAALLYTDKSDAADHIVAVQDITPKSLYISSKHETLGICIPAYSKIPSEGILVTFQAIPLINHVAICHICERSQHVNKDILESFQAAISDSYLTAQLDEDIGVRVFINNNGILTLEGLHAEIIRNQSFISKEDIETMQHTAKQIKNDCKIYQELMQCRDNLDGCIIRVQAEFQSMNEYSAERNTILNVCEDILNWMSNNEEATKKDYESKQDYLQLITERTLTRLHPKGSQQIEISEPLNQSTPNSVSECNHNEAQPKPEINEELNNTIAGPPDCLQHTNSELSSDSRNPNISMSSNQHESEK